MCGGSTLDLKSEPFFPQKCNTVMGTNAGKKKKMMKEA